MKWPQHYAKVVLISEVFSLGFWQIDHCFYGFCCQVRHVLPLGHINGFPDMNFYQILHTFYHQNVTALFPTVINKN